MFVRPSFETASALALTAIACLVSVSSFGCATTAGSIAPAHPHVASPDSCARVQAGRSVRLAGLFDELSDLTHLARLPEPGYRSLLASSFDPASRSAQPGQPEWFANRDFVPLTAGETLTLLDVSGPGVITRIWSANPSGVLRIYLDGAATPSIEVELAALLRGEREPFVAPFAFKVAGGYNLYFPISFASGCRVTLTSDAKRIYYQLDHRSYAPGTPVEPFSPAALARAECQRARAAARLDGAPPDRPKLSTTQSFRLPIEPGVRASHRVVAADGGSAIRQLTLRPSLLDPAALRGAILSLEFDGERTVQVPLGDFFGTGPGPARVESLPVTVDPVRGVFVARWLMPFRREATLAVTGASGIAFEADFELISAPLEWTDASLLFGAQWHAPHQLQSKPSHDWPLIRLRGRGVYVGTQLNLINGDAQWWGEGDEKIFVDGEKFPSHFGTGTEDYFGYGFCSNSLFTGAFVGQTRSDARQNWGAVSLYRFHTFDPIPFESDLRFDLEVNHWGGQAVPMVYDAIGFYYARPGAEVEPIATDPALYTVPAMTAPAPIIPPSEYRCGSQ